MLKKECFPLWYYVVAVVCYISLSLSLVFIFAHLIFPLLLFARCILCVAAVDCTKAAETNSLSAKRDAVERFSHSTLWYERFCVLLKPYGIHFGWFLFDWNICLIFPYSWTFVFSLCNNGRMKLILILNYCIYNNSEKERALATYNSTIVFFHLSSFILFCCFPHHFYKQFFVRLISENCQAYKQNPKKKTPTTCWFGTNLKQMNNAKLNCDCK